MIMQYWRAGLFKVRTDLLCSLKSEVQPIKVHNPKDWKKTQQLHKKNMFHVQVQSLIRLDLHADIMIPSVFLSTLYGSVANPFQHLMMSFGFLARTAISV